jgi:predicted nucleic acid-binding protein
MIFDTDVMIWFFRGKDKVADLISSASDRAVSCVTYAELIQGARNKAEIKMMQKLLREWDFQILMLDATLSQKAMFYVEEYALSHGVQWPDALIASTVLQREETLMTANAKHFTCIPGLQLKLFKP